MFGSYLRSGLGSLLPGDGRAREAASAMRMSAAWLYICTGHGHSTAHGVAKTGSSSTIQNDTK